MPLAFAAFAYAIVKAYNEAFVTLSAGTGVILTGVSLADVDVYDACSCSLITELTELIDLRCGIVRLFSASRRDAAAEKL